MHEPNLVAIWLRENPALSVWAILAFIVCVLSILAALNRYVYTAKRDHSGDWFVCLFLTVVSLIMTIKGLSAPDRSPYIVINIALATVVIWTFAFHLMAFRLGRTFTKTFGPAWVKFIDYTYLGISTIGVMKLALNGLSVEGDVTFWNAIAVILIGIALAMRFTKTTVEIKRWDQPEKK